MDPMRRLLGYSKMYVDLDMVPRFLKVWYNFFSKKVICGKKTFDNDFRQCSKHLSNN